MTWEHASLSKSHFLDELLALLYTFTDELLAFAYTFMDEHSNPKMHKHEENTKKKTKKTRKIHAILRIFRPNRGQNHGAKQPVDL